MAAKDGSRFLVSATPVTVIAHLFGVASVKLMLVWILHFRGGASLTSDNKEQLFNVISLALFFNQLLKLVSAAMAYKIVPGTRKAQRFVHMALLLISLSMAAFGLYIVFKFQHDIGMPNMYSVHSWLGMGTVCLFALQWFIGFFAFLFPGAQWMTRARLLPWHAFFGFVIFAMAICSAETGLIQKFIFIGLFRGSEALIVNFIGLTTLLFGISVGLAIILPCSY
ncbi:putative ascorbate-specific transmembrane electron transporter 1 [Acorus calamus]|uniref:Ascorbate-specific transmembrane electron transporter 1 n=1 Tax=Acorus calamus TaxID=4465 RepID=A0AAV9ENA9_ACOCL|nr:putative ascorbate-specific transmembrane electron transporter 1 [Acorus calamus]